MTQDFVTSALAAQRDFARRHPLAEALPMKIAHEFPIHDRGEYRGMIFGYMTAEGLRWSHSLSNHGSVLLPSAAAATADFWETKQRLPAAVHRVIFGAEG